MIKRLALTMLFLHVLSTPAVANCAIKSPYQWGEYASEMFSFVPGHWFSMIFKKKLHSSRLFNPSKRALGCPKLSLQESLTLGHQGYVILGLDKCFRNGNGPDILIHEPRTEMNTNETFNVYVTEDETGKGEWYKIASNISVSRENNFIELEIDGIFSPRGYPLEEFRWLKIEDANSKVVLSNRLYSGFDVSAVKFLYPCHVPVS